MHLPRFDVYFDFWLITYYYSFWGSTSSILVSIVMFMYVNNTVLNLDWKFTTSQHYVNNIHMDLIHALPWHFGQPPFWKKFCFTTVNITYPSSNSLNSSSVSFAKNIFNWNSLILNIGFLCSMVPSSLDLKLQKWNSCLLSLCCVVKQLLSY